MSSSERVRVCFHWVTEQGCVYENCRYAHYKTRTCSAWARGKCPRHANNCICKHTHGDVTYAPGPRCIEVETEAAAHPERPFTGITTSSELSESGCSQFPAPDWGEAAYLSNFKPVTLRTRKPGRGGRGGRGGRLAGALPSQQPVAIMELDKETPEDFICPISHDVMIDPVVASDGFAYERHAIETWFKKSVTSPITGNDLETRRVFPNHILRRQIVEWSNA